MNRRAIVLGWLCGAGVAWGTAFVLRRQQRLMVELRAAQDALAEAAAAEERARIARELHDVVAHSLTVTLLHVSAARLAVQDRPGEAAEQLAEAERLGRRSLTDVRRAVGVLGSTDGALPTADDLSSLVEEYRAAGMEVTLRIDGDVARLSPATSLAFYRITEESLANAARHAPGAHVEAELRIDAAHGRLRVANGPGTTTVERSRPGLGLTGIRQRTELIGGTVTVGPEGRGWSVAVEVPL